MYDKQIMTSSHHPETNGNVERLNTLIVTRLKCKVYSSSSKISCPKLLNEVLNLYNLTLHSVAKFLPSYLLRHFSCDSLIPNNYYLPVDEALKLVKE